MMSWENYWMRLLDRWVGVFFCFLLTLWDRCTRIVFRKKTSIHTPRKILFIKLIEQGAMVLATSAIRKAQDWVGKENVYVCVFKKNSFVLPTLGILNKENQIIIDSHSVFRLAWDTLRFIIACRRIGIDTAIDFEFFSRGSAILCYLSGAQARVGMHGFLHDAPYRGDLMTHKVSYNPYIHTAFMYRLMVEVLKENPGEIPLLKVPYHHEPLIIPTYQSSSERLAKWQELLSLKGEQAKSRLKVILTPNPNDLLRVRKWELENYVQLIERVINEFPNTVFILTGLPEEREALSKIVVRFGEHYVKNIAGETDFEDLLTLYSLCDLLVTNDSGPAHFATTSNIDIVVLFGPETPTLFAPLGDRVHIIYSHYACSPCLNAFNYRFSFCQNNLCLKDITVDEVYAVVRTCLQARMSSTSVV